MKEEEELKQALVGVATALDQITESFRDWAPQVEKQGADPDTVNHARESVTVMENSALIFMPWAYHYLGIEQEDESPEPARK